MSTIRLTPIEREGLRCALAKHRLTIASAGDNSDHLIMEISGHPHVNFLTFMPGEASAWSAEWTIDTDALYLQAAMGAGLTPSAAIEALLAHIAALAKEPTP